MRGNGHVYLRGRVFWIAYYRDGQLYRESARTGVRTEALALLRSRLKDRDDGTLIEPKYQRGTVGDLLTGVERDYTLRGRASLASAKSHLAVLRRDLGTVLAKDLDYDRLSEIALQWQRDPEAPVSPATVNRRFAVLRRAYRLGRRSKRVAVLPEFPHFEELDAREGFFERGEFLALLAALPDDGLRDFVEWAYWTGMRKGEAASLQWKHLDRETWTIRLPAKNAKTRKGRALALRGAFRAIIERRIDARRPECPYIFHRDGEAIAEFRKAWATACKAAGLTGRLFHDLRRTGVRNLVRGGVSRHVAMAISGHRTDAVFRRYDITTEEDLAEAAERVTTYVATLPEERTVTPLAAANIHKTVNGTRASVA